MNRRMLCPWINAYDPPTLTGHSHEMREDVLRPTPERARELGLIRFLRMWASFVFFSQLLRSNTWFSVSASKISITIVIVLIDGGVPI